MEDYAAKMQAKSDADLRQYVTGHAEYREDAVLAALDELRRRGQPAPEEGSLRPGLEAAAAVLRAEAAKAEAAPRRSWADAADPDAADGPMLYSPGTIVLFSVLFSWLGGGVLLGLNLRRLGLTRSVLLLAGMMVAYLIVEFQVLSWAAQTYGKNMLLLAALPMLFNVGALVAYLLWFWPSYVGGQPYRSRSWLLPFMLFFALQLALVRIVMPLMTKNGVPGLPGAVPTAPAPPAKTPAS